MAKKVRKNPQQAELFTSRFEDEYLFRTLGDLVRKPDVALGELVANAWDAGASRVEVTIPEERGQPLVVADDGTGLTKQQFNARWMTLAYNRQKHQGQLVEFPPGRSGQRRAYGRNGQGRHGLLCFGDAYRVETRRDGTAFVFEVGTASGNEAIESKVISEAKAADHGTKLTVEVSRNKPDPDRVREVLAAKFLYDPGFVVAVNGTHIPMTNLPGFSGENDIAVTDPETARQVTLTLCVVEADAGRAKHQSGVAFWVGSRLVGDPGWNVLGTPVLDGRTRPGRRLTFVVKCDELEDEVLPDWTDFRRSALMVVVRDAVVEAVRQRLEGYFQQRVRETTAEVLDSHHAQLDSLEQGERYEIEEATAAIATSSPLLAPETLSVAVSGMIAAKQKTSPQALIQRILALPDEDIQGLERLLDEWSVRDAMTVLDEIGRRIRVVEALEKLMGDPEVDELHVLHPLVTQARWLFGPEYDSPQYASNVTLRTAMHKILGVTVPAAAFKNPRKRPDLVVLADSTISAVGAEDFDPQTDLPVFRRILLVELKKGGFTIGRNEMNQAEGYIEDLLNSGHITGLPTIDAFVVGHVLDPQTTTTRRVGDHGRVEATTFGTLVRAANRRLFNVREQVQDRYPDSSKDLVSYLRARPGEAIQLGLDLPPAPAPAKGKDDPTDSGDVPEGDGAAEPAETPTPA